MNSISAFEPAKFPEQIQPKFDTTDAENISELLDEIISLLDGCGSVIYYIHWKTTSNNIHELTAHTSYTLYNFLDTIVESTIAMIGRDYLNYVIPQIYSIEEEDMTIGKVADYIISVVTDFKEKINEYTDILNDHIDSYLSGLLEIKYKSDIV